jgi:hypothetical protein
MIPRMNNEIYREVVYNARYEVHEAEYVAKKLELDLVNLARYQEEGRSFDAAVRRGESGSAVRQWFDFREPGLIDWFDPEYGTKWLAYQLRNAVADITPMQRSAVQFWHSWNYTWFNQALRDGAYKLPEYGTPEWRTLRQQAAQFITGLRPGGILGPDDWRRTAIALDSVFEESKGLTKYGVVTYRGVPKKTAERILGAVRSGAREVHEPGYFATTLDKQKAAGGFAGGTYGEQKGLVIEIHVNPGDPFIHVPSIAFNTGEDELLFARGQNWRVKSFTETMNVAEQMRAAFPKWSQKKVDFYADWLSKKFKGHDVPTKGMVGKGISAEEFDKIYTLYQTGRQQTDPRLVLELAQ